MDRVQNWLKRSILRAGNKPSPSLLHIVRWKATGPGFSRHGKTSRQLRSRFPSSISRARGWGFAQGMCAVFAHPGFAQTTANNDRVVFDLFRACSLRIGTRKCAYAMFAASGVAHECVDKQCVLQAMMAYQRLRRRIKPNRPARSLPNSQNAAGPGTGATLKLA